MSAVQRAIITLAILCYAMGASGATQGPSGTPVGGKPGLPINIDLNVADVLKVLGQGVDYVVGAWSSYSTKERRDGVSALALRLNTVSGMELGLARTLELYSRDPAKADYRKSGGYRSADDAAAVLNAKLLEIKKAFSEINDHLTRLNPTWSQTNASLVRGIGSFTHDGILFYKPPSDYWVALSRRGAADELIADLRAEAEGLAGLADKLDARATQ